MKNQQNITPEFIKQLSYTDFVGFINQWNVLPGSYSTLSKWAVYSKMNKNSRLLEVACTTGFSSRELATLTGCSGEGFDLSEGSIEVRSSHRLFRWLALAIHRRTRLSLGQDVPDFGGSTRNRRGRILGIQPLLQVIKLMEYAIFITEALDMVSA